jgi:hypothetical protein
VISPPGESGDDNTSAFLAAPPTIASAGRLSDDEDDSDDPDDPDDIADSDRVRDRCGAALMFRR